MAISIKNLTIAYNDKVVVENLNLGIRKNKVSVILGPSGCGKTSILNALANIVKPLSGEVQGIDQNAIAYIFQEHRLLPWKTVQGNLEFVIDKKEAGKEGSDKIKHILEAIGMWDYRNYYPYQLSGGMKQRVSIARAFVYQSELILLDEAFKGLDIKRKMVLIDYFINLLEETPRTAVFVSHDIQEALLLGDDIHIISENNGKIIKSFEVNIDKKNRSLTSSEITELEKEIYKILLNEV